MTSPFEHFELNSRVELRASSEMVKVKGFYCLTKCLSNRSTLSDEIGDSLNDRDRLPAWKELPWGIPRFPCRC